MEKPTRTAAFCRDTIYRVRVTMSLLLGLFAIILLISYSVDAQTDDQIIYVTVNRSNDREIRLVDTQTGETLASAIWDGNWWTSAIAPNTWQIAINDNSGNLQILDLSSGTHTEIPAVVYVGPTWSPDGESIAFTGPENDTGDDAIKILNVATGKTRTLAESASYVLTLAWSPNGSEIAFSNIATNALGIVDTQTDQIRYLLDDISSWTDFVWSPDGTELVVFDQNPTDPNTTLIRFINTASGETRLSLEVDGHALEPAWSPDGTQIIFALDDLYLLDVSTGEISSVAEIEGYENLPQWSPDGEQIALISNLSGSKELYVLTLATGDLRQLTESDDPFEPRSFAWINSN